MGREKAAIRLPGAESSLAERAGSLLAAAVAPLPALEVGPGVSGLPTAADFGVADPRTGPLTAVVAGWQALEAAAFSGDVVVVATDLPRISLDVLTWLVEFPADGAVVPVVDGRAQPLAARWSRADLERAVTLAHSGERSLRRVFGPGTNFVGEAVWGEVASAADFLDVDTPEDLEATLREPPPGAPPRARDDGAQAAASPRRRPDCPHRP